MKKMFMAAALVALAGSASAQGYVGALAGLTKTSSDCLTGLSCDSTDKGYKFYGGYSLSPNFAVEVGYTDFGKLKMSGPGGRAEIHGTAFSLVGALRGQFTPDVTGVARLGIAAAKGKLSSTVPGLNGSDENMKLYAGLGIEYAMTKELKLNAAADFTTIEYEDDAGSTYIMGVGLQYGF